MQSLKQQAAAKRLKENIFALCMVVVVETPTRRLVEPRTPKQGAFFIPNSTSMKQTNKATQVASENEKNELTNEQMCEMWDLFTSYKVAYDSLERTRGVFGVLKCDHNVLMRGSIIDIINDIDEALYKTKITAVKDVASMIQ